MTDVNNKPRLQTEYDNTTDSNTTRRVTDLLEPQWELEKIIFRQMIRCLPDKYLQDGHKRIHLRTRPGPPRFLDSGRQRKFPHFLLIIKKFISPADINLTTFKKSMTGLLKSPIAKRI